MSLLSPRYSEYLDELNNQVASLRPTLDAMRNLATTFQGLGTIKIVEIENVNMPRVIDDLKRLGIKMEEPRNLTHEENEILLDALWNIGVTTFIFAVEEREFEEYFERVKTILRHKDAQLDEMYREDT